MKKFLIRKLNPHTHNATIVKLRMNGNLELQKTKNCQRQTYKGAGVNSKGAASIFLVMSVLLVVLAIALGSSFIVSSEIRTSLDSNESVAAYYAAETGIEQAIYEKLKGGMGSGIYPTANKCSSGLWTPSGAAQYCLVITETTPGDYTTITKIQSIGDYKSTRRSIEITF